MTDDLDDLLRRSMKTLDDQVPSGYFDGLPNRTLARLEDSSIIMQTTQTSSERDASGATGVPPRDDDSGLHDIRNLASSARMRLTSRRVSTMPPVDEDILASSSAGWKAVALPEPAKMVSLPELADLPSKAEVKAKESRTSRRSRPALEAAAAAAPIAAVAAPVVAAATTAPLHLDPTPAVAPKTPMIGARIAAKAPGKNRNAMLGVIGFGLAAAAGATFFIATRGSKTADNAAAPATGTVATSAPEAAAPPPVAPARAVTAPVIAADDTKEATAAGVVAEPIVEPIVEPAPKAEGKADRVTTKSKAITKPTAPKGEKAADVVVPADPGKKPPGPTAGAGGGTKPDGEPDFGALLKEAGVADKQEKKVALEKKSLTGVDFKAGMGGVAGKAQGCYSGTQGTASVKLTIAPSGKVSKVSVSGVFAGTPVAACIESAVRNATFPAWDGNPQSFGYSYLLSE